MPRTFRAKGTLSYLKRRDFLNSNQFAKALTKAFVKVEENKKLTRNRDETKELRLLVDQVAREFFRAKFDQKIPIRNEQYCAHTLGQMS
jgi:hypothetical protein